MNLVLTPQDRHFAQNLHQLRHAIVTKSVYAPDYMMVVINGRALDAMAARMHPSGLFAYTDEEGEHRLEVDNVDKVEVFFTSRKKRSK